MEPRTKKDFSIEHILSHRRAAEDEEQEDSGGSSSSTSGDEEDSPADPNNHQMMTSTSTNGDTPFINPLTNSWLQDYGAAAYFGRNGWPISHSIRPQFFTLQGIDSLFY